MKKIKNAYLHAHRFCELMQAYKFNKYPYIQALEDPEYIKLCEPLTGKVINQRRFEIGVVGEGIMDLLYIIIGYGLYILFNPLDWYKAKKYYNSKTFDMPSK